MGFLKIYLGSIHHHGKQLLWLHYRKGKNKRFSSLAIDDHHGDTEPNSIDFDPTPPARVELRPHTNDNSSNKLYQRYSMPVLDNMDFEDDDITATIADV